VNSCNTPTGAVLDVVDRMDSEIDLVVTGHTNWAVNCKRPDGKIITGAAAFGRLVTDIGLTVSRATKDVIRDRTTVNNVIVTRTGPAAPDLTALVTKYGTLAAPVENRVIGVASATLSRTANAAGESSLGDIIADAQLWATKDLPGRNAQISFMNAGGIRADINPGEITYGEAFTVQPFGNILVTMRMTGAQIDAVLEQQFTGGNGILQIPASLTYERHPVAAAPDRVRNIKVNGVALDPTASYWVTVNNFLADGGDSYTVFRQGSDRFFGEIDLDAFARYVDANRPTSPGPQNRITLVP
jgi:5'-nucleotidase